MSLRPKHMIGRMTIAETYVVALVNVQVRVHIPLVSTPHGSSHARPRLLERQDTLDIIALELFTGDRIDDSRLNAKEGESCGTRLGWCDAAERCNDVGSGLGLPVGLPTMTLACCSVDMNMFILNRQNSRPQYVPFLFQQLHGTMSRFPERWAHRQIPKHASAPFYGEYARCQLALTTSELLEQRKIV